MNPANGATVTTSSDSDSFAHNRVATSSGIVEGTSTPDRAIRIFRGIPFAAPPIGPLRFAPPQPVKPWSGILKTDTFGPRAMQLPIFGDMNFRSNGMSEDCLYLNVWTPATSPTDRLPVLVYFYGGGNMAGDGSEPRYDGETLARRGIVTLTVNYRLGAFGFFAHPELSRESPYGGSGNQGFLDQNAALLWVRDNISAFGGDPARVTIAGESAGSIAVSIQMASPLSKDLIAGAIGSSGSALAGLPQPRTLADKERIGTEIMAKAGAASLSELRAMPAEALLAATESFGFAAFSSIIDGYLLPSSVGAIFEAGQQAHVPLLVGWNSEEWSYHGVLGDTEPTLENYISAVRSLFDADTDLVLDLYSASTNDEVIEAATDLAGDSFLGYSTWKWSDLHGQTGHNPVFRYYYTHPRPPMVPELGDAVAGLAGGVVRDANAKPAPTPRGAVHSADIEYAMGNLATNHVFAWTDDDYAVSEVMQQCYVNFVKTGDPNGEGVPTWPAANTGDAVAVMHWDVESKVEPEHNRERYLFHDRNNRAG